MAVVATYTYLKGKIQVLNLFEHIEEIEEEDLKNQRISTWIFLILLVLSIISLLVYASLTTVTKTIVIQQPEITDYKDLKSKYPNTLVCPCQQILNAYSTFIISFTPKFNQICSSDFVSEQWLDHVNYRLLPQIEYHYMLDFRHSAYSFFQMLRTLCSLVSQTIIEQLIQFYAATLLTETLISEEIFLDTVVAFRDQFLKTTSSSFQISLNSLRIIIQADQLVNRLGTNYILQNRVYNGILYSDASPQLYPPDDCVCSETSYCNITTGIFTVIRNYDPSYGYPDYSTDFSSPFYEANLLFHVPGINVGCFILDAVLQSNLSCLYNTSCLSQLNIYLNDSLHPFEAKALNISNSSLPTVNNLVENLIVDEWLFNFSYESYFSQCNPSTCTYTYTTQFDILFIITTVMGVIGGIVTILMLFTLPLVSFTRRFVCRRWRSSVAQNRIDAENSRPFGPHPPSLPWKIKNFVINVNLFKDLEKKSDHDLKNQHISTRLFIVSMVIALTVLILYTSLTIVTQTVIIKQPTINDYTELQIKYAQTLVCPCTQTSIDYEQFISFRPTYHQICSSDFITIQWINYLVLGNLTVRINVFDLRYVGASYFSSLLAFCDLSLETINNALFVFNSTKYITKNVQQTDLFQSQTEQIINLFKQRTTNSYLQILTISQEIISGNALFSGLLTNYAFVNDDQNSLNRVFIPDIYNSDENSSCSCKLDPSTCGQSVGIYQSLLTDDVLQFTIPNFWIGCYLIESLSRSTFECYYNQSCLDQIYQIIGPQSTAPFNATAMIYNSSNTQYNITTKIETIFEQLMLEQWNEQVSFIWYFEQCYPVICIYTYNKQGDLSYVFTTIIALIGGLTTILRILIPPIIAFLRRKNRPQPIETDTNEHEHTPSFIRKYIQLLKNYIVTLNLFKNPNKRSIEQIRYQHISTRIFIIFLIASLIILLGYISLENITQVATVKNPSINQFNLLYQQYSGNVRCPCQTLSIHYQDFTRFNPQFHAVCDSDFIKSRKWLDIEYFDSNLNENNLVEFIPKVDDFRQMASPLFQLLSSFCRLSLQILNTELLKFNFTTFITPNLVSQQQFQTQINQIIDQFIDNTARSFIRTLRLVNNMTFANMLLSALSSDSILSFVPQYYYYYYGSYYQYLYDQTDQLYNSNLTGINCDCQENPFCIQQAVVYDLDGTTILFPVPGIYVGCYVVEALLQSDLRCFYDDFCLKELISSLYLSTNTSALSNSTSIYEVTTTLEEIVSNLMIEQWNNETSYEDYFNECQPNECLATYVHRGNIPYIVTTMTGLIGGLTKVYMFVIPLLVKIIYPFIIRLKQKKIVNIRVVPLETTSEGVAAVA